LPLETSSRAKATSPASASGKPAQLVISEVNLKFGGITVLEDVSLTVEPGQIFGLVGPNGAGKTSLFNCISGHYKPTSGSIQIDGVEVLKMAPDRLPSIGLSRTFQHPALQLTVSALENVLLGAHSMLPGGPVSWSLRVPRTKKAERAAEAEALEVLDRFGLADIAHTRADELAPGIHKSIELCRALLSKPRLLLLDEPAAGLTHGEVEEFIASIGQVRDDFNLTIVIVEHNMGLISAVTDRVLVLERGRKLMEGTAAEAQNDPRVIEAYLGQEVTDESA
jgi:branched-chain amino acid transport system ATP-binding protein